MFFSGHITILLFLLTWNKVQCFGQRLKPLLGSDPKELIKRTSELDLEFSDTNHGEVTNTDQNVLYINHGGGATSSIRRNLVVPSQFTPHVNSYPNSLFDNNNYPGIPLVNYALEQDIPRTTFERRNGNEANTYNALPQEQPFHQPLPQEQPPAYHNALPQEQPYYNHPQPQLQQRPPSSDQHLNPTSPPNQPTPRIPIPLPAPLGLPPGSSPSPNQQHFNQVNPGYRQPQPQQPFLAGLPGPGPQPLEPNFFNFFEQPFQQPPPTPLFQRRRLTLNNNNNNVVNNDISVNSISNGYPAYNYYKGDEEDAAAKWPKIFKFTDGRINLSDFEKDKKLGKVKFAKDEPLFDNVRRDSFLILHGGTYS